MIDWLLKGPGGERPDPFGNPVVEVAGRELPIVILRRKNAKRLTMRLAPDGKELRISLPSWGRSLDAIAFARARTGWIESQLGKVPEPLSIADGAAIAFRGSPVTIRWDARAPRRAMLDGECVVIGGPQDRIEARLRKLFEGEALTLCAQDLAFYCDRAALPAPGIALSRARRRWGSCSADTRGRQTIRINWRLVMAPDFVRRSVVAHEVAHLTHFDHSPAFHAHLSQLYEGDIKLADRWLKARGPSLYACFA